MPIAVEPQPGNNPPRVLLELSGLSGSTATVLRTDPDGRTWPVRTAEPATLTGGGWVGFDYEAPFGQAISYTVIREDGTKDTATNVARRKTVTLPGGFDAQKITDGVTASDQFAGIEGLGVATIDLGSLHTIDSVRVWHYYLDGRTYHGTKVELSTDAVTWDVVFDSAVHGTYAETAAGKLHTFSPRPTRYVRQTANGSTANTGTHFVETQVLAPSATFTLNTADVWLIHPGSPTLSVRVDPMRVGQLEPRTRAARSAVLEPLGRQAPLVVFDVRASPTTGLSVLTETLTQRAAIVALVNSGAPVLLNVPPALGWGVGNEWAAIGDVTEDYFNRGLSDTRIFTLPYIVVTRPVGAGTAEWAYSGVLGAHPDYTAVLTVYGTYSDVVANATNET